MKLRTVKDMKLHNTSDENRIYNSALKEVREEAIKWVKDIRNSVPSTSQKKEDIRCYSESFIKHFFNITEEDLKSEEKK